MKQQWKALSCLAAAAILANATETKTTVKAMPAAVQTAIRAHTAGAAILASSEEREKGSTHYEVETKVNGKHRDLTFASDGTLLEVEQEVSIASVPAPAIAAIEKKAAGGSVQKVESVTRGAVITYEADVRTRSGKTMEVSVDANGAPQQE